MTEKITVKSDSLPIKFLWYAKNLIFYVYVLLNLV